MFEFLCKYSYVNNIDILRMKLMILTNDNKNEKKQILSFTSELVKTIHRVDVQKILRPKMCQCNDICIVLAKIVLA